MGVFILIGGYCYQNFPISNIIVAETSRGLPIDEEARKGQFLIIHRYKEKDIKWEDIVGDRGK